MTKNRFYVKNESGGSSAEMFLFGIIGEDLNAEEFVRELKFWDSMVDEITVRINSGGGSVFDGLAIYNALKQTRAAVVGHIDGLCASMATVIALGMDKVLMSKDAQFMTHKPSGLASGSSGDLKGYANMMDNLEKVIADVYAMKTGLSSDEVGAKFLRDEDTWFSADQALSAKLIDGVFDSNNTVPIVLPKSKSQKELVSLFNSHIPQRKIMKQIVLTASQLANLSLTDKSEPAAVASAIDTLIAKAGQVDQLKSERDAAVTARTNAENDLNTLKTSTVAAKVDALLDKALNVDKKITVEGKNTLKAQYGTNPDGLETVLKLIQPITVVSSEIKEATPESLADKFKGTWDELDKAGKLEACKLESKDLFKAKFKAQFNKEYVG